MAETVRRIRGDKNVDEGDEALSSCRESIILFGFDLRLINTVFNLILECFRLKEPIRGVSRSRGHHCWRGRRHITSHNLGTRLKLVNNDSSCCSPDINCRRHE